MPTCPDCSVKTDVEQIRTEVQGVKATVQTLVTEQAVASERWATVTTAIEGMRTDLRESRKELAQSGEKMQIGLLEALAAEQRARRDIAVKTLGIVGSVLATLAAAAGFAWHNGVGLPDASARGSEAVPSAYEAPVSDGDSPRPTP